MLLRAISSLPLMNSPGDNQCPLFSSASQPSSLTPLSLVLRFSQPNGRNGLVVSASKQTSNANNRPLTGVVFEPFEQVKKELSLVPSAPQDSLARQKYPDECEAALNEQIK